MTGSDRARRVSRAVSLPGVVLAFGFLAPSATATTLTCGATVTHNVSLSNNLTNCPTDGIDIGADGLTIRLNGHTISGQDGGDGINFQGHGHVTLIGGPGNAIEGFDFGLYVDGDYNSIDQVLVRDDGSNESNQSGVDLVGDYNQMTDSVQVDNPITGLATDGTGNTVSHDTAIGPSQDNQAVAVNGEKNVLTQSRIEQPQSLALGIYGQDASVSHNVIAGSPEFGIQVNGAGATISDNTIGAAYEGVILYTGPSTLTGNIATHDTLGYFDNGGSGVSFVSNRAQSDADGFVINGGSATLTDNVAGSVGTTSGGGGGDGTGIVLTGGSSGTVLTGNNASNDFSSSSGVCANPDNFYMFPCDGIGIQTDPDSMEFNTTLTNNTADWNKSDGINVSSDGGTLSGNTAYRNHGDGIAVDQTGFITMMNDGGGNKAAFNGGAQCVGITCS